MHVYMACMKIYIYIACMQICVCILDVYMKMCVYAELMYISILDLCIYMCVWLLKESNWFITFVNLKKIWTPNRYATTVLEDFIYTVCILFCFKFSSGKILRQCERKTDSVKSRQTFLDLESIQGLSLNSDSFFFLNFYNCCFCVFKVRVRGAYLIHCCYLWPLK